MKGLDDGFLCEGISEDAVFIIGSGHFGSRAARLLNQKSEERIFVVDLDKSSLSQVEELPVRRIVYDGVLFLIQNFSLLKFSSLIVPAVPVHLVFEWLRGYLETSLEVKRISLPQEIKPFLPFTWPANDGSLLVSFADFMCPDDCSEPEYCTVTGERRDTPLYDLISGLELPGFNIHVIRSKQLAAGLGGYRVSEMAEAAEMVAKNVEGKWLIGTACRCHGILTAFETKFFSGK
ncbi:MAG: hypothetical protein JXA35_11365 [Deltaproteobacteria bacterium]|nr:hypothetical protein [Deltaproteobacteria bacterium]